MTLPWQPVGAVIAVAVATAALVPGRPVDGSGSATLQGVFIATVCCGLLCVAMMRWSSLKYLPVWVVVTLATAAGSAMALYWYGETWHSRVATYQGEQKVVGDEYTPHGATWIKTHSTDLNSLLFDAGGIPETLWTPESIERSKRTLRRLYLAGFPLLALSLLSTIQAIQSVFATKRGKATIRKAPAHLPSARILFLAANPLTTSHLDLEEELRGIEAELRAVRFRHDITLTTGHAARADDLVRLLRQHQPSIVHFSGHGEPDGIVLRTEAGHAVVPGDALTRLFRDRGVALVVLNACYSDTQARQLLQAVPAVIGTTDAVDDEAARRFSVAFYRTLGNGHPVKDAFRDAGDAVAIHALVDVFAAHGDLEQLLCGVPRTRA